MFYVIIAIFFVLVLFLVLTKPYVNDNRLIFVFGKKGAGKSTVLSKLSYKYLLKGRPVYSTEDLQFVHKGKTYQSERLDPRKIYTYSFPRGSVVFIDEVSLIWDNRDFKRMDKRVVEWFRYQRHYGVKVYLFSQTFDIDKKLRDLADDMFLVNKYGRVWAVARHMIRKPVIVHPSADAPARIDDDIIQDGILLAPFGGCIVAFIPHWAKLFDSFKKPQESPSSLIEDTAVEYIAE